MKKLLLVPLLLLLSSCAPLLQTVQQESASLSRDGQTIVFRNPGTEVALAPALLLVGKDVTVNDEACKPMGTGFWGCALPDVGPGQQYRLTPVGPVKSASITFYRSSSGPRPVYLELP